MKFLFWIIPIFFLPKTILGEEEDTIKGVPYFRISNVYHFDTKTQDDIQFLSFANPYIEIAFLTKIKKSENQKHQLNFENSIGYQYHFVSTYSRKYNIQDFRSPSSALIYQFAACYWMHSVRLMVGAGIKLVFTKPYSLKAEESEQTVNTQFTIRSNDQFFNFTPHFITAANLDFPITNGIRLKMGIEYGRSNILEGKIYPETLLPTEKPQKFSMGVSTLSLGLSFHTRKEKIKYREFYLPEF